MVTHEDQLKTILEAMTDGYNINIQTSDLIAPSITLSILQVRSPFFYAMDEFYEVYVKAVSAAALETIVATLLTLDTRHKDGYHVEDTAADYPYPIHIEISNKWVAEASLRLKARWPL
jgi:hypothetical protein